MDMQHWLTVCAEYNRTSDNWEACVPELWAVLLFIAVSFLVLAAVISFTFIIAIKCCFGHPQTLYVPLQRK